MRDPVPFRQTRPIAKFLTQQFLEGNYDKVSIAFTNFVNTLRQESEVVTLLPIQGHRQGEEQAFEAIGKGFSVRRAPHRMPYRDYTFEPNVAEVLAAILPLYINYEVFQAHVESRASEHSARMVAMKTATDNAKQIHQGTHPRIQQAPPGRDHLRTPRNHHRDEGHGVIRHFISS